MNTSFAQDFEIFVPISKAEDAGDGRIAVSGIISDESTDWDSEVVKASGLQNSFAYLQRFGKFNLDHRNDDVGDITYVGPISTAEAQSKYGIVPVGQATEVKGYVYPIGDPSIAPVDLKTVRHRLMVGARLGFSIQGSVAARTTAKSHDGSAVNVVIPKLVNKVAITPQPKNFNTCCTLAKSLSGLLSQNSESQVEATPSDVSGVEIAEKPPLLFIAKGMMTTGAVATSGTTGADAAKVESLAGNVGKQVAGTADTAKCRKCGCGYELEKSAKYCSQCGKIYKSVGMLLQDIFKVAGR